MSGQFFSRYSRHISVSVEDKQIFLAVKAEKQFVWLVFRSQSHTRYSLITFHCSVAGVNKYMHRPQKVPKEKPISHLLYIERPAAEFLFQMNLNLPEN